jgi:hypothetical protein
MAGVQARAVRIQADRRQRRTAIVFQCLLVASILGLLAAGGRVVGVFWPERAEPETGHALWLFVATVSCAALTLAWLVVLLHDLVKMTIEITDEGVAVERLVGGFRARWDEVREIGLVPARGHLTLRSVRGNLTVSERLAALRERVDHAFQAWTPWAAARRQLVVFLVPAVGLGFLLVAALGIRRRRLPSLRGGRR